MNSLLTAYLVVFGVLPAAFTAAGWMIADHVRERRDQPIPYVPTDAGIDALALAVTCHWCRLQPDGRCTCGINCGHHRCPQFTRAELEYLDHGTEMPR